MVFSIRQLGLLIILCVLAGSSQAVFAGDDAWREVTPAELQMKTPKVEADADAEAIFWEVRIDDSSDEKLTQKHYVRVKIFTERGREKYSKFDIPFIKGLKIKDIAARVIRPDGSIIEILKTDIFEREIVKAGGLKIKAKSFAVPNIEPGVIVEYRYKEVEDDAGAVGMHLVMQHDIPVQSLSYYYKPYNERQPNFKAYVDQSMTFVKDKGGFYLASKVNVPSFKEEPRMPPEEMIRPWILLQGTGISVTDASIMSITVVIKDPNNPSQYWGAVGKEKSDLTKFITKADKELKKTAADITASAASDEEKLQKLYEFCQTQLKNTSFDVSLTDDQRAKLPSTKSFSDVLKRKSGSAQWIDMTFGALASALGYETRVAYSGDRSRMFFEPQTMANEGLIHPAAIAVNVGGKWKFYNPGMYFLPPGMLIWYEEDVWALLVGANSFSWVKTPFTDHGSSASNRTGKFKLLEDGTLEGEVTEELTGQPALTYKMSNYDESPAKREEDLKAGIKSRVSGAEVTDVVIENVDVPAKPVIKRYKVRIPSYAQKTGKRLFLQPGFFKYGENALFSSATRKFDVYFSYPWEENDAINITLPSGYDLDSADAPGDIADRQGIGLLKVGMTIDKTNNVLKYDRKFFFGGGGNTLFPVVSYSALKQFFDNFHVSDTHTVTLKQK